MCLRRFWRMFVRQSMRVVRTSLMDRVCSHTAVPVRSNYVLFRRVTYIYATLRADDSKPTLRYKGLN